MIHQRFSFPCFLHRKAFTSIQPAEHDKINNGAYGDTGCPLHFHLVPKYKDEFEWDGIFAMNPGAVKLTDTEYAGMIEKIKENL